MFSISHATFYLTWTPQTFDLSVPNQDLIIHALAFGFKCWQNKSVLETPQIIPKIKPTSNALGWALFPVAKSIWGCSRSLEADLRDANFEPESGFSRACPIFGLFMHFRRTFHWGKRPRTVLGWGSLVCRFQKWCQEVKSDLWGQNWARAEKSSFWRFQRVEKKHEKRDQTSRKWLRF